MVVEAVHSPRFTGLPDASRIFGCTPAMQEVRTKVETAAVRGVPVLIEGESGTGKEVVARYIHLLTTQNCEPFVRVLMMGRPPRLLELELFGSEHGLGELQDGTHGANSFRSAGRGTLFLDEIFEMELPLQQRLNRFLEVGRDGEDSPLAAARVFCASTLSLERAIAQGRAEKRSPWISGCRVKMLPLRERKEDIPSLCEHLLENFARSFGKPAPRLSPDLLKRFQSWDWPGNIRELENWIARIVIFGTEDAIGPEVTRKQGLGRDFGRHRRVRSGSEARRRPRR